MPYYDFDEDTSVFDNIIVSPHECRIDEAVEQIKLRQKTVRQVAAELQVDASQVRKWCEERRVRLFGINLAQAPIRGSSPVVYQKEMYAKLDERIEKLEKQMQTMHTTVKILRDIYASQ